MRLIDADTLNYVRVRIYHDDGTIGGYNAVVPSSEIKNAPTVDAVPVIRCKDCKYWSTDDGMFKDIDERQWHHCPHLDIDTEEYFYCSEAKRKEECGHQ